MKNTDIADILLHSTAENWKTALEKLTNTDIDEVLHTVQLLAALHPDEDAREAFKQKLKTAGIAEEQYISIFKIFYSAVDFWAASPEDIDEQWTFFNEKKHSFLPLLAKYPIYTEQFIDLGRKLYLVFGLEEAAQTCFEDILVYNDQHPEVFYALGRIFEKQHQYRRALAHYERCLALDENHLYALLQKGYIKASVEQRYNEAIYAYQKVLDVEPYNTEAYIRMAEAHYELEDYDRTKQLIEVVLGINEFNEQALNLLGTMYWKVEKDYEKAEETYQKGIDHQLHGDSGLLLASFAEMQIEYLQDYDKGRIFYEKSLAAQPAQPKTLKKYIELLCGHYQDVGAANDQYLKYLRVKPNDAFIHTDFAKFLLEYLQDYPSAEEHLRKAIELDGALDEAQELLHKIAAPPVKEDAVVDDMDDDDDDWDDDDDDDDDFVGGGAMGDN